MLKDKLFIAAMAAKTYLSKKWVISAFSIMSEYNKTNTPFEIIRDPTGWLYFDPELNEYKLVLGLDNKPCSPKQPLYSFAERLTINQASIPNNKSIVETSYGILLVNFIILVYAFNDKIPYQNKEIKITAIENLIAEKLVGMDEPQAKDPAFITVNEYKEFVKACGQLEGFTQLCVPTYSEKSITTDPAIKKRLEELKKEYEGQLSNPAVIAKIDAELVQMDRDWLKGDPSERFHLQDKSYTTMRKKMYSVYGGEVGLGDGSKMEFIGRPLKDGIKIENLPATNNSLRSGSYDRGQQTALGGVATKEFFRVFQNCNITQKDCGSSIGILRNVRNDNASNFVGLYYIANKKSVLITDENIKSLIGSTIEMRSPATCKTTLTDYCETCMGINNSRSKNGLGAAASEIGSRFMGVFMKSMHGKTLSIVKFDFKEVIN